MHCSGCNISRHETDYSSAQKKKSATARRCKMCQQGHPSVNNNSQVATTNPPVGPPLQTTGTFQLQIQNMVPTQFHNEQMNALFMENAVLKREREQLLAKALDLALPTDIKKQVDGFKNEIDRLQRENESLRLENTHLREQISRLEADSKNQQEQITNQARQISVLMDSYVRENKIALRTLFTLARDKNVPLTPKMEKYIKKNKSTVNIAAHVVTKERIKEAVDKISNSSEKRTVCDLYQKVFPDVDAEDSEADDFYD